MIFKKEPTDEGKGWLQLDELISSVALSLVNANNKMVELKEGSTCFSIKEATVEITYELHASAESPGVPKVRLPVIGRRVNSNFNESDLCKITFTLGRFLTTTATEPAKTSEETPSNKAQ